MSEEAAVKIEFDAAGLALLERVEKYPDLMIPAVARAMTRSAQVMLGTISAERFTGQGPYDVGEGKLGVRTNRLRASLRATPAEINADAITVTEGSNVGYFGVHEFGFEGDVAVKSFKRQVSSSQFVKAGGQISSEAQKGGKKAKREALGKETVKAHQRHLNIPARAPLGHGIADHLDIMTSAIIAELNAAWEGRESES